MNGDSAAPQVLAVRAAHEARPYPARFSADEQDAVLCDIGLTACARASARSLQLDAEHRQMATWAVGTLEAINDRLSDPAEREFVDGLLAILGRALLQAGR